MAIFRYLTHPQVVIDANVKVPNWRLSEEGRARAEALAASDLLRGTARLISSDEVKAKETAAPIAKALGLQVQVIEASHENDRSATGFLPPDHFEAAADQFFAHPEKSFHGWETAHDAQKRILKVYEGVRATHRAGDLLMIGHGGVGTLLYCALAQTDISRQHDQHAGGGCLWSLDLATGDIQHGWLPIEELIADYVEA